MAKVLWYTGILKLNMACYKHSQHVTNTIIFVALTSYTGKG